MCLSRHNFRIALLAFVAMSLVVIFLALEHQISLVGVHEILDGDFHVAPSSRSSSSTDRARGGTPIARSSDERIFV